MCHKGNNVMEKEWFVGMQAILDKTEEINYPKAINMSSFKIVISRS